MARKGRIAVAWWLNIRSWTDQLGGYWVASSETGHSIGSALSDLAQRRPVQCQTSRQTVTDLFGSRMDTDVGALQDCRGPATEVLPLKGGAIPRDAVGVWKEAGFIADIQIRVL